MDNDKNAGQIAEVPSNTIDQTSPITPATTGGNQKQEGIVPWEISNETSFQETKKITAKERLVLNAMKSQGHIAEVNNTKKQSIKHS